MAPAIPPASSSPPLNSLSLVSPPFPECWVERAEGERLPLLPLRFPRRSLSSPSPSCSPSSSPSPSRSPPLPPLARVPLLFRAACRVERALASGAAPKLPLGARGVSRAKEKPSPRSLSGGASSPSPFFPPPFHSFEKNFVLLPCGSFLTASSSIPQI